MKKYENFCNALLNLKDIYEYKEPYGHIIKTVYEKYYQMFCDLKVKVDEKWM